MSLAAAQYPLALVGAYAGAVFTARPGFSVACTALLWNVLVAAQYRDDPSAVVHLLVTAAPAMLIGALAGALTLRILRLRAALEIDFSVSRDATVTALKERIIECSRRIAEISAKGPSKTVDDVLTAKALSNEKVAAAVAVVNKIYPERDADPEFSVAGLARADLDRRSQLDAARAKPLPAVPAGVKSFAETEADAALDQLSLDELNRVFAQIEEDQRAAAKPSAFEQQLQAGRAQLRSLKPTAARFRVGTNHPNAAGAKSASAPAFALPRSAMVAVLVFLALWVGVLAVYIVAGDIDVHRGWRELVVAGVVLLAVGTVAYVVNARRSGVQSNAALFVGIVGLLLTVAPSVLLWMPLYKLDAGTGDCPEPGCWKPFMVLYFFAQLAAGAAYAFVAGRTPSDIRSSSDKTKHAVVATLLPVLVYVFVVHSLHTFGDHVWYVVLHCVLALFVWLVVLALWGRMY